MRSVWLRGVLVAVTFACCWAQPAAAGPSAGGLSSDTVEYVDTVPLLSRGNGGRLVGKHFYMTTGKDLFIFDVSNAEAPVQVGHLELDPLDAYYVATGYQEDVDTNGKLLLRAGEVGGFGLVGLQVVDVSDPTAPRIVGTLEGITQHTIECVLDCTWAYGSDGAVIDLRDPTNPQLAGNWSAEVGANAPHDVTEVAPGIVLTSSNPMMLLDVRSDPTRPQLLALTEMPGFVHGNLWPNGMADDIALAGGEQLGPNCFENQNARFYTLDTAGWQSSQTFRLIAEFALQSGVPTEGRQPVSQFCTHWFDHHPAFRNGGLVAMAAYEPGTRFLKVDTAGAIEEIGWFLPHGGSTWAAYWISDRIVYAVDHHRGIDILRWTGDIPPGRPNAAAPSTSPAPPVARALSFDDLVRMTPNRRCVTRRSLRVTVRRHAADPVERVVLRVDGRRALTATGRRLRRPLRLRRLPGRRFTLQVTVRTRSGHSTAAQRSYRRCG